MCGIWFLYDLCKLINNNVLINNAFMKIKHRGPDYSELKQIENVFIGFHRLAIMDISPLGNQPFELITNDKIICAICNGEIYNYKSLKQKYNIETLSKSDCEILPHLYNKLGMNDMLQELIGEFAMVIIEFDIFTNKCVKILSARDRYGVRPLFLYQDDKFIMFSSELKGLTDLYQYYKQLPKQQQPGTYHEYTIQHNDITTCINYKIIQYSFNKINNDINYIDHNPNYGSIDIIKQNIKTKLIDAVEIMMCSDRPLGALLSGGLDSSLIVSIASKYLKNEHNLGLHTFSIGLPGSTDKYYAELVANYCNTIHTHFDVTNDDFINAINDVIYTTETYDITTIRASVGQYLISKKIKENTNIKVLLIGDGSDELTGGYLYFKNSPSPKHTNEETKRLIDEIHYYDVLRADRGISRHSLEARVPFLNHEFVEYYLGIPAKYKYANAEYPEKWLLRESFIGHLPDEVLWRKKEAFSDGVSSVEDSWFMHLLKIYNEKITNTDFNNGIKFITHCKPPTKEAYYYRTMFRKLFNITKSDNDEITQQIIFDDNGIIPNYWLPKWSGNISEPSARILNTYQN